MEVVPQEGGAQAGVRAAEAVPRDKYILLVDNRQEQRLVRLGDSKKLNWRKTPIALQQVGEHPFFTPLEVGNHSLQAVGWDFGEPEEEGEPEEVGGNNREIFEIEEAQKLQAEDIARMKRELLPSEIISGLVENNEQFSKRTEYSKQKYLRKKERKYLFRIHAQPVSLDALHHYYFAQDHRAVGSIRWEMLALLLLYAAPLRKLLLAEQTKGIILAAALARGAQAVTVAAPHKKSMRSYPIVEQLNITAERQEAVAFTSWEELVGKQGEVEKKEGQGNEQVVKEQKGKEQAVVGKEQTVEKKEGRFDNLVLLGNYNFSEILSQVEPQLKEGAIIAFYCQSLGPLEEAGRLMRERKYLNVRLQDSWSRDYQVLQNRTHPLMYMDSASGFLLTGFKVTA